MINKAILTGVTPSGIPHLGNYIGAIKPALQAQHNYQQSLYFVADYHSLIKLQDAALRRNYVLHNAATWLALGLDPQKTIFYRQSKIAEIPELMWILSTVAAKGLLNRAHAYKDLVAKNLEAGDKDPDAGITMGLFNYPVLMAADILIFKPHYVPVGKDQIQHVEIARDIAQRFNHIYGETFILPEAVVSEVAETLPGLDGRKMSKSYDNTIPLFLPSKDLRKLIMKIKTNSQAPEEPKSTENCTLFTLFKAFAGADQVVELAKRYAQGVGWGEVKQSLFELLDQELSSARERYDYYLTHPEEVMAILEEGELKARTIAQPMLQIVKEKIGL
jgi:tryptophanyl-tRNA synthetase